MLYLLISFFILPSTFTFLKANRHKSRFCITKVVISSISISNLTLKAYSVRLKHLTHPQTQTPVQSGLSAVTSNPDCGLISRGGCTHTSGPLVSNHGRYFSFIWLTGLVVSCQEVNKHERERETNRAQERVKRNLCITSICLSLSLRSFLLSDADYDSLNTRKHK